MRRIWLALAVVLLCVEIGYGAEIEIPAEVRDAVPPEAAVLLGDRLYTDIACAVNAGIDSVFVLSGEGTRDDIERDGIRPTWVYDDINAVFRAWEETP